MSAKSQTERVVSQLREIILSGEVEPGERLTELHYAKLLGVSRTPLRLAFAELEKEGLLEQKHSRGFRVRSFSIDHIGEAVEVRGVLEGMAARILCERGLTHDSLNALEQAVKEGQKLINGSLEARTMVNAQAWRKVNQAFHHTLVESTQNSALLDAIEFNNKVPFSGPGAMTLKKAPTELETAFVQAAQKDHELVLDALRNRQGTRAEALMREHAYKSHANKKQIIEALRKEHSKRKETMASLHETAQVLQSTQA